jgi:hypothetical protein
MGKIKKLGTTFVKTSDPANMHILDINNSIEVYNNNQTLQTLQAVEQKVKQYEFAKLSVSTAIDLKQQIEKEMDEFKKSMDHVEVRKLLVATVNCRAGGRTLQIDGGGGDSVGEGGGYKAWKECGMEAVVQQDAVLATKIEEVSNELSQKVTTNAVSSELAKFLKKPSPLNLEHGGQNKTFPAWVQYFRGQGVCAQKTSSDAKQWLLSIVKGVPHFKNMVAEYTMALDTATKKGEDEYNAFAAERKRLLQEQARLQKTQVTLPMPEDWQMECFNYGNDSGNWVLQEFVIKNQREQFALVKQQFALVEKAVDDFLTPQLKGMSWRNAKTPTFQQAWEARSRANPFT